MDAIFKELEERLVCPYCKNTFTDPRRLPCLHTLCTQCLQSDQVTTQLDQGVCVHCPICQEDTTLQQGLDTIPASYYHAGLSEILGKLKRLVDEKKCSPCSDNAKQTEGELLCLDCVKMLCEQCCKTHEALLPSHQTLCKQDITHEHLKKLLATRKQECSIHPDKHLEFYCKDCRQLVCISCSVVGHSQHPTVELNAVSEIQRTKLTSECTMLTELTKKFDAKLGEVDETKADIKYRLERSKEKIKENAKMFRKMIEEYEEAALKDLEGAYSEIDTSFCKTTRAMQESRKKVAGYAEKMSEVLDCGTHLDVTLTCTLLEHKLSDLTMSSDAQCKTPLQSVNICSLGESKTINIRELFQRDGIIQQKKLFDVSLPWVNQTAVAVMEPHILLCGSQKANDSTVAGLGKLTETGKMVAQVKKLDFTHEKESSNMWVAATSTEYQAVDIDCSDKGMYVLLEKITSTSRASIVNVYGLDGKLNKSITVGCKRPGGLALVGDRMYISSKDDSLVYQCEMQPEAAPTPQHASGAGAWFQSIYDVVATVVTQHALTETFVRVDRPGKIAATEDLVVVIRSNTSVIAYNKEARKRWIYNREEACMWPHSVSIDKEGRVLVAFIGSSHNQIHMLSSTGVLLGHITIDRDPDASSPYFMTTTEDGHLVVVDNNKLAKYAYQVML